MTARDNKSKTFRLTERLKKSSTHNASKEKLLPPKKVLMHLFDGQEVESALAGL